MSLKISNNTVNDMILGQEKTAIDHVSAIQSGLHLEFDYKVSLQKSILVTVSEINLSCFILNNREITTDNFSKFLEKEEALFEENGNNKKYIIPKYNLAIMIGNDPSIFEEVLVYHESLKKLYESGIDELNKSISIDRDCVFSDSETITPYKCVGCFEFGILPEFFSSKRLNTIESSMKNSYEINNNIFKFKESKLIQISVFDSAIKNTKFYYNNIVINSYKGLQELKEKYKFIVRKNNRFVFQDIGICINQDLTELYIFDRSLLPLWLNEKRPITSW